MHHDGEIGRGKEIEHNIREAIELYIESLVAHGEEVPTEANTLEYTVMIPTYA